jgi:folate-dependent phosphoribosylglycinamide formyltransferase PurN
MIHLVPDEAVDEGPVVAQQLVPIYPGDTLQALEARVHHTEHRLLVQALHDLLCPTPDGVSA